MERSRIRMASHGHEHVHTVEADEGPMRATATCVTASRTTLAMYGRRRPTASISIPWSETPIVPHRAVTP